MEDMNYSSLNTSTYRNEIWTKPLAEAMVEKYSSPNLHTAGSLMTHPFSGTDYIRSSQLLQMFAYPPSIQLLISFVNFFYFFRFEESDRYHRNAVPPLVESPVESGGAISP